MFNMLELFVVFSLTLILWLQCASAFFVHIDAHADECYFDQVLAGSKISLIFEVVEGGFLDIDVKVGLK